MRVVIIGNHAAGLSAAETLRRRDESCEIRVISDEDVPPYSRCLIPYLVSGEKSVSDILYKSPDFYEENGIDAMLARRVVAVVPQHKEVLLGGGEKVGYDALIIANGGTPSMPRIAGVENDGVFAFRTLEDAENIVSYCDRVETAIVLGGGLVGLKAAIALNRRGKNVKVVVGSPNVLSQIIAEQEASVFEAHLAETGIEIITRTNPAGILGEGTVEGVETTEGRKIAGQMVIVGKGVSANKDLVKGTDIQAEYGIIVDEHCRTSVGDIYAAGDVAQVHDDVRGQTWTNALWPHAVEEGRVAAENVLGVDSVLRGRTSMNAFVIDGLALISCGLVGAREEVEGGEQIIMKGPDKKHCKRFVLRDGRLVGFALLGDVANAGVLSSLLSSLVISCVDVTPLRDQLLAGRYDFASMMPLIRENMGKFERPEYQEVLGFI